MPLPLHPSHPSPYPHLHPIQEKTRHAAEVLKLTTHIRSLQRECEHQRDALSRVLWGDRPEPPPLPPPSPTPTPVEVEANWSDWADAEEAEEEEELTLEEQALLAADNARRAKAKETDRAERAARHTELMSEADAVIRELEAEEEQERSLAEVSRLMNSSDHADEMPEEGLPMVRLRVTDPVPRPRPRPQLTLVNEPTQHHGEGGEVSTLVVKSQGQTHDAPVHIPVQKVRAKPATYSEDKKVCVEVYKI